MTDGSERCKVGNLNKEDKPPVIPRAPSFWTVGTQRSVFSVWCQGGTATPVIQFLYHNWLFRRKNK